jgi:HemY protein
VIGLYLALLLAFGAGIALILAFGGDPGYALIHYGPYVLESTAATLLFAAVAFAILFYFTIRVLSAVLQLPRTVRGVLERRRRKHVKRSFESGLQRLFEGDWTRAEIDLVRRVSDQRSPYLNYLAAARAAQRLDAYERRDHYLELAGEHDDPEVLAAVLMTRAELYLEHGEFAAAKAAAESLRQRVPNHPYAIELLAVSLAGLGEWDALIALLAEGEKLGAPSPQRRAELRVRACRARIADAVARGRIDQLKAAWDAAAPVRSNIALRRDYIFGLARLNADAEAAAQIEAILATEWDGALVRLYGDLHAADAIAHLATVERWLTQYGERPELLRLAGRACLEARLWGKAQSYLDASLRAEPTSLAHFDLARLFEQTQRPADAAQHYREGLALAAGPVLTPPP